MTMMGQHLPLGDGAGPGKKVAVRSKLIEMGPQYGADFLVNIVGVLGTLHLTTNVGIEPSLAGDKVLKKSGGFVWFWHHMDLVEIL